MALLHVRDRATLLGGSVALWATIFHFSRGSITYWRQKEDPLNASLGGFLVGMVSHSRGGLYHGMTEGFKVGGLCYGMYAMSERG